MKKRRILNATSALFLFAMGEMVIVYLTILLMGTFLLRYM
ncbi:hypothetical protein SAMN02910398_03907 [Butyrivibrio sp. YAB3001]|nr:hypothetical protein SAMN02910398_03907 [Butyrivibrio sp. YAB3001]